jgi:hypothetical protein
MRDDFTHPLPIVRVRHVLDVRRARRGGLDGVYARRLSRLRAALSYARAHSPFFEKLYRHLPAEESEICNVRVTHKHTLMNHFAVFGVAFKCGRFRAPERR